MIDIYYWEDCQVNLQFFLCLGSICRYSRSGALLSTVPQSRHIGNLMGKEMVIALHLTLVQEDTTITWCLIATLQGIKHLHQDEKRREPVSPKAGCQQVTVVGGLGSWAARQCSEMRGQEARMEEAGRRLRGRNIGAGVRSSGDSGRSPATPHTTSPSGRRRGL